MNITEPPEPTVMRIVSEQEAEDIGCIPSGKEVSLHATAEGSYPTLSSFEHAVYWTYKISSSYTKIMD